MNAIVDAEVITIGRNADIVIDDPSKRVSRLHCEVTKLGNAYFLCNLSKNGTYIKEKGKLRPVDKTWIKPGQTIRIGKMNTNLKKLFRDSSYEISWNKLNLSSSALSGLLVFSQGIVKLLQWLAKVLTALVRIDRAIRGVLALIRGGSNSDGE